MSQHYSDPSRESDPHALPDIETFYVGKDIDVPCPEGIAEDALAPGWHYWFCFPGCLPDGDPLGPFDTEAEALADAREGLV